VISPEEPVVSTRSFTFLVNPASGGGAAPETVVPVARLLREAGASVDVTYSPGPRAMGDLVAAAVARGDVVVSVGGDGMLSSLAGAVSAAGGTLALLPAGRGNDFARMLGLPEHPLGQAELLLSGAVRPVDLLSYTVPGAEPRLVAGSVYSGVDARAAELVDRMRWVPKKLQYPYAAVRSLATYQPGRTRRTTARACGSPRRPRSTTGCWTSWSSRRPPASSCSAPCRRCTTARTSRDPR
jgi:diacylglycerol kinase family enzyme